MCFLQLNTPYASTQLLWLKSWVSLVCKVQSQVSAGNVSACSVIITYKWRRFALVMYSIFHIRKWYMLHYRAQRLYHNTPWKIWKSWCCGGDGARCQCGSSIKYWQRIIMSLNRTHRYLHLNLVLLPQFIQATVGIFCSLSESIYVHDTEAFWNKIDYTPVQVREFSLLSSTTLTKWKKDQPHYFSY